MGRLGWRPSGPTCAALWYGGRPSSSAAAGCKHAAGDSSKTSCAASNTVRGSTSGDASTWTCTTRGAAATTGAAAAIGVAGLPTEEGAHVESAAGSWCCVLEALIRNVGLGQGSCEFLHPAHFGPPGS